MSDFDPTILEAAQQQAQTKLQGYIETQLTDPTVGDVIGGRRTIVQQFPILPAGLPKRLGVEIYELTYEG